MKIRIENDVDPWSINNEYRLRLNNLVEILEVVVAPSITMDNSEDVKQQFAQLLDELREYKFNIRTIEVMTLHVFPERIDGIYERISDDLLSKNEKNQIDAINALSWLVVHESSIAGVAQVNEVCVLLSNYLMWCSTRSTIFVFNRIIIILNQINILPTILENAIIKRLAALLTETAYDNEEIEIDFNERVLVRSIASRLTATLWDYYKRQNLQIPEIVNEWGKVSLSDNEFSDVGKYWRDINEPV